MKYRINFYQKNDKLVFITFNGELRCVCARIQKKKLDLQRDVQQNSLVTLEGGASNYLLSLPPVVSPFSFRTQLYIFCRDNCFPYIYIYLQVELAFSSF